MVKRHGTVTYLSAVGMREKAVTATFDLRHGPPQAVIEVLGESRSIPLRDGRFNDDFGPYGVHLYRIPL